MKREYNYVMSEILRSSLSFSSGATAASQTQVAYLLLLIVSTSLCTVVHHYVFHWQHRHRLSNTDTNEHSKNTNPLAHIRHTIFSSCFSSAFPNG